MCISFKSAGVGSVYWIEAVVHWRDFIKSRAETASGIAHLIFAWGAANCWTAEQYIAVLKDFGKLAIIYTVGFIG